MSIGDVLRRHNAQLTLVEDRLWLMHRRLGVPVYDFDFEAHFDCSHPYRLPDEGLAVARIGPLRDYEALHASLAGGGLELVHDPGQYARATDLTQWYDALEDLTPRSAWWPELPGAEQVEEAFQWPVFVKGERQTNRHDASSVVRSPTEFEALMERWLEDPVLSWQRVVVREYVELDPVAGDTGTKVSASFEFRTFWWRGELVGAGRYWEGFADYDWSASERAAGVSVAGEAARRMGIDFLVVDIARTVDGRWIVIELNEGQESGYAGVPRLPMWREILSKF
jgi:hypothetical protein